MHITRLIPVLFLSTTVLTLSTPITETHAKSLDFVPLEHRIYQELGRRHDSINSEADLETRTHNTGDDDESAAVQQREVSALETRAGGGGGRGGGDDDNVVSSVGGSGATGGSSRTISSGYLNCIAAVAGLSGLLLLV
jgi:hypothetical protein